MERSQATVDSLLVELVAGIHDVLGDDLVGVYLYGSYVSGGFDSEVSDLDMVAVISPPVEGVDLAALDGVHKGLISRHPEWSDRVEVVYVGLAALQSFRTSPGPLAVISPGEPFHFRSEPPAEWVQNWYLVRETGVALYGPDPATIIPPIEWAEFDAAAVHYAEYVSHQDFREASPGALAYSVLTLCRAARTVREQVHGSKREGADWAKEAMPEWAWLIDEAIRCRLSRGTLGFEDEKSREAAQTFIGLLAATIGRPPSTAA
jgi:predicted nucleotidyltransferase